MAELHAALHELLAGRLRRVAGGRLGLRPERLRRAAGRPLGRGASRERDADAAAFLARLDAIPEDGLFADEAIDRDLARSVLRGRLILAPFEAWKRDPLTYTGPINGGLFMLFLHRLPAERDRVDASIARLAQVGAAVDAGIANLDPSLAHPLIVERGLSGARGRRPLRPEPGLAGRRGPGRGRRRLRARGRGGRRALDRYVAHLEGFLPRAHGSWQLGEEGYSRMLQEREALVDDARSLRERGPGGVRPARRRDVGARAWTRPGTATTSRSSARTTRTTRPPSRRCSRHTRTGPRGARQFLARRPASSRCPRARPAPSTRRRCSSGRCWASRPTWRRRRSATR